MRSISICITFMMVLFSGCASFPDKPEGNSIIVVPIMKEAGSVGSLYLTYKVFYSEGLYIEGMPERSMVASPSSSFAYAVLKPGKYTLYAYDTYYTKSGVFTGRTYVSCDFECRPNSITIAKQGLRYGFSHYVGGVMYQISSFVDVDEAQRDKVKSALLKVPNIEKWTLVD